jgi:hypothetical protein
MPKNQNVQRSQQPKDLGEETARFHQRIPLTWWGILFLSILGGVLVWYWSSMLALSEAYTHGLIRATESLYWGIGGIGFFTLIGIISLIGLITYPRYELVVYEKGFSYRNKREFNCLEWEEITGLQVDFQRIWWFVFLIRRRNIILHLFHGGTLTINHNLQKLEEVKAIFEQKVFPVIMERIRSGYEEGAIIPFGPILLSKANGLKYQNTVIRWGSIHTMSVDGGWLTIVYYVAGGALEKVRCQIKDILNLSVMLTLIRESLQAEEQ